MAFWCCPVCGKPLAEKEHVMACPGGHSYDVARQGYVNLLCSGQSSKKHHGDDALMVDSRTRFLEKGYYAPIRDGVLRAVRRAIPNGGTVLDAGCGEGYYTAAIGNGTDIHIFGADISRAAVKVCARRGISCAVASCARLPAAAESCDGVMCLFAPMECGEYARVLKKHGVLITAVPLEAHLTELKAAVYAIPRPNDAPKTALEGFLPDGYEDVRGTLELSSGEDIRSLFCMTPYWYKTGREDQKKLEMLEALNITLAVRIAVWRKE